jgi:zinc protease
VYGFGINADIDRIPYENYHFSMTIPCAPENADKLVNAVLVEIERMKTQGPTKDEVQKEIETQRRAAETDVKQNNWWMFCLDRMYAVDKDFGRAEKPFELCEMLTPELLKEMAQKYLDTRIMVRYTLYPENYKKDSSSK